MRTCAIGLAAVLVAVAGWAGAGEIAAQARTEVAGPVVSVVPGPPLWRPAEQRPKAAVADTLEQVVDRCVGDAMAAGDTPGASVAVIVGGELVYEQGYGVKRRGGTDPVDAETMFRIGSVTKMLTAAAVMQQVDAGTVFLDDEVTRYVPELAFAGHWPDEAMTVEHLLTHATGIPDLVFHRSGDTGPNALSDWAASLAEVGLHAPPGTFYNYSNPNFNLAGLVVERVTGIPYREYMASRVFGPAGMTRTTFDPAVVAADGNAASGHDNTAPSGEVTYSPDGYDNCVYAPAGYAFSTAGDLARWALLLADGGGAVLSPHSAAAMQSPRRDVGLLPGMAYGYGVFVEPFYDLTVRQHGGNIWGWGAFLLWHPERRFAVAVLANTFQSLPDAAYCIADAVLEPDHSVVPSYPVDPDRIALFEGVYEATLVAEPPPRPYPVLGEVLRDGDELLLMLWDPNSLWFDVWPLEHVALDLYLADVDEDGTPDLDLTFLTSAGTPERVRWLRMRPLVGTPQVAPRSGGRLAP
jgi:CubicO group peptidase (beta-lactamase class C family)